MMTFYNRHKPLFLILSLLGMALSIWSLYRLG